MRLAPSEPAPDFELRDVMGKTISLRKLRGKPVLLALHRFSGCPFCNLRVAQLKGRYDAWHEKGLEVITIFESSEQNLREGVVRQNLPFSVVSDSERKIYELYRAETSVLGFLRSAPGRSAAIAEAKRQGVHQNVSKEGAVHRMPADFLIDVEGRIHTAHYGTQMNDHVSIAAIQTFVDSSARPG